MTDNKRSDRLRLRAIAFDTMRARGLDPDFSQAELAEAAAHRAAADAARSRRATCASCPGARSTTTTRAISISCRSAEALPGGDVRLLRGHRRRRRAGAAKGRRSIATPRTTRPRSTRRRVIFPMLPERLSTDLTSLNEPRIAWRSSSRWWSSAAGELTERRRSTARVVRNHAKLAYNAVGAWLTGDGPLPPAAAEVRGLDEQLRMQDRVAQALRAAALQARRARLRDDRGASTSSTARRCATCRPQRKNRAKAADRELHDRGQRRHRAVSRRARVSVAAPRGAVARALGAHRRAGGGDRRRAAGRRRLGGAGRVPGAPPGGRPGHVSRSLAARSSSCSARANTSSIRPARSRRGTSAWRCATTRTRRRRTGAIPISSRSGC